MPHDLVEGRSQEGIWRGKQVGIGSVWKLLRSWVRVPHLDSLGLTLALYLPAVPWRNLYAVNEVH